MPIITLFILETKLGGANTMIMVTSLRINQYNDIDITTLL